MRGFKFLVPVLVAMMLAASSCSPIDDYEDNPALVRSEATVAGSATIYAYFAASEDARKHADKLDNVVVAIRDVMQGFPAEGFMSLYPKVAEILKAKITGDNLVYLPLADMLAQVLLQSLQQQSEKGKWADKAAAAADIVAAFLSGADTALAVFRTKAVSP